MLEKAVVSSMTRCVGICLRREEAAAEPKMLMAQQLFSGPVSFS